MKLVAIDKKTGERRNVVILFQINDQSDMGDLSEISAVSCMKLPSDVIDAPKFVYSDLFGVEPENLPFTLEMI